MLDRHNALYPVRCTALALCVVLEKIRPEIRQYFLESDVEATPFSRSQRSLACARAKGETDKRPFGCRDEHGRKSSSRPPGCNTPTRTPPTPDAPRAGWFGLA